MGDSRYSRQERFAPIGIPGQERIRAARVAIVGCGALGAAVADQLARAGVGGLRLIDRDVVEASNLQRQTLFSEDDAASLTPKAVAAAARLGAVNAEVRCAALVTDLGASNAISLISGCDLVIDGTDNFPTRHLINEACCAARIPWIYGACVGAYGVSMAILPGETPCLRCIQDQVPAPGESPTCDTAGIIAPAVQMVAGWQAAEALKLLVGDRGAVRRDLWASDLWRGTFQRLRTAAWRDPACAVCGPTPSFPLLSAGDGTAAVVLCGRDAVQIRRAPGDPTRIAAHLGSRVELANAWLVRWSDGPVRATCFADGRVLVQGVADAAQARSFCDRWLG